MRKVNRTTKECLELSSENESGHRPDVPAKPRSSKLGGKAPAANNLRQTQQPARKSFSILGGVITTFSIFSMTAMKIGPGRFPGQPVALPIEIIEVIVAYVGQQKQNTLFLRQADLWSLCLVSREWYAATIKELYRRPSLGSRNFDLFTRTICPPINSRGRALGLEEFITELHMGHLAYVTSSSMTARLLRKTRNSLVTFAAPSQSMSTSSLAPISKLTRVERLDLSRDKYDFDIRALLRAVQHLNTLKFLSLPRGVLSAYPISDSTESVWPPNLEHLQINNMAPGNAAQWRSFIHDLPPSLHTLSFQHLRDHSALIGLSPPWPEAPNVTSLSIAADEGVDFIQESTLFDILHTFPGLTKLSLSEAVLHYDSCFEFRHGDLGSRLQVLTFSSLFAPVALARSEIDRSLLKMIKALPQLQRLEMAKDCTFGTPAVLTTCHSLLTERGTQEHQEEKGVFHITRSGKALRWNNDTGLRR